MRRKPQIGPWILVIAIVGLILVGLKVSGVSIGSPGQTSQRGHVTPVDTSGMSRKDLLRELQAGMRYDQVIDILGQPDQKRSEPTADQDPNRYPADETWVYELNGTDSAFIHFEYGRLKDYRTTEEFSKNLPNPNLPPGSDPFGVTPP